MPPTAPEGIPGNPIPGPPAVWMGSVRHPIIRRTVRYIDEHYHRQLTLAAIASVAHMSKDHFSRLFHESAGVTFQEYLVRIRVRRADEMIRHDPLAPLIRVAARAGFGTIRNLQRHYKRLLGKSPSKGRERAFATRYTPN